MNSHLAQYQSNTAVPASPSGTFGALTDRLSSLVNQARELAGSAAQARNAIIGLSPTGESKGNPKAVPNGHIGALDDLMDELSASLTSAAEALGALLATI